MIFERDGALQVEGALTMADVGEALAAAKLVFGQNQQRAVTIDLGKVTEVDSSALAVIFEWLREAQRRQITVKLANLPDNLQSLAELYGVTELLPIA